MLFTLLPPEREHVNFTQTSSTTQKHFRESETKRDEELVQSLIQQIEQLQRDVVAKDREMAEMRKQKENEAADVEQMRQQNRDLETALGVEKVERENAVSEERRRGAMREERLQVDKLNLQRQFDESRVQIEALQCSLNDLRVQKSNIEELLSDAEATIERYKEREQTEVLRIASHDIQLTDRKLGGGSYGGERCASVASYQTLSRRRVLLPLSCYTGTGHDGARGFGMRLLICMLCVFLSFNI